jgi:hypothetical protein
VIHCHASPYKKEALIKRIAFMKLRPVILIAGLILFIAGSGLPAAKTVHWSRTDPPVNQTHIFEGEINKRGKPVGFHSRPGGNDPANARVVRILEGPNDNGIYIAIVRIRGSAWGQWREKRSTFFPDRMDRHTILKAILYAYRNRSTGESAKFRGPSGHGFTIEGWLLENGAINTAYPIFR